MADYVIFDSAAGLGEEAKAAIEAADELILVTNPEIPAVTDALKTIKFAENLGKEVRGVIITRVRNSKNEMSPNNIRDMLETPLIGIVPEDKNVQSSVRHKDALVHVYPYSKASMAYKRIAARLADIDYKEPGLLKRLFGRN